MRNILIAITLSFLVSACSFPGVYKIDIPQGNIVTQEMVDQLRPGMTQSQVRYVLGTPLITDTFSDDRWDYVYSMKPGGGATTRERVTIYFTDGELSRISGDYKPSATNSQ